MSDPLSISFDTTGIKTGRPIIVDNHICKVRLANISEKTGDNGKMIIFEYHLLDPAPTKEGDQVKPGFSLRENVTLYDKETPPDQVPKRALQRIAQRQDAFLGTGDPDNKHGRPQRPAFDPACVASMIGKEAYLKVRVPKDETYGNEIASVINPQDLQA